MEKNILTVRKRRKQTMTFWRRH